LNLFTLSNIIFVTVALTYSKGQKEDPRNYRPVSLTSMLGKIMEQFVLSVLTGLVKDRLGWGPSSFQ